VSLFLLVAGIVVVVVGLLLCIVLLRLNRTLMVAEELLITVNEELRETLPEVRGSLGNVNDITATANVALRAAGEGASRLGDEIGEAAGSSSRGLRATLYGLGVAGRSLWRSYIDVNVGTESARGRARGGKASGQ